MKNTKCKTKYRFDETIENALIAWVQKALNIVAIWDKQDSVDSRNSQRPKFPYAVLSISRGPASFYRAPELKYKDPDLFEMSNIKTFMVRVEILAKYNHMGMIGDLEDSLGNPNVLSALSQACLAFWDRTEPIDVSRLLDTRHELRAQMDITFSYRKAIDIDLGVIETAALYPIYNEDPKDTINVP